MKGSFGVIRVKGIPVRFHWTFAFLLVYVLAAGWYEGLQSSTILLNTAFLIAAFFCIVLHELGHAFAASLFNIRTSEVLILPVGGIAYIEKGKLSGGREFFIAFCGPLTNLLVAGAIWIILQRFEPIDTTYITLREQLSNIGISFSTRLMWINLFIFAFNLIPVLPLDGGVMVGALLKRFFSELTTEKIQFLMSILFSAGFLVYSYLFHAVEYLFFAWFLYFTARLRIQTRT